VNLTNYDILIVGKAALSLDNPAPDIARVKDGLKVLIFEQGSEVLEKRFGFRVEEYGLRQVFPRVPDHPALAGLGVDQLRDWRGQATLLPSQLTYQLQPRYGPTVEWSSIRVPHLWRCGNRGNVASVLIEKPARGDFLPIVDGGFSLQYTPLLEYHEGKGMILFCQLDVTSRSEPDPAAEILVRNLLACSMNWKPSPRHEVVYVGDARAKQHLESVGIIPAPFDSGKLSTYTILVAGPGCGNDLAPDAAPIATWLKAGGTLLTLGLPQDELRKFLPPGSADVSPARLPLISTTNLEHISTWFEPFPFGSFGAGIAPADLHNRDPRNFPLVADGARVYGDGILAYAQTQAGEVILCQIAPWDFSDAPLNQKRTHRRVSFLLSRLLANLGATSSTPLLERFHEPVSDPTLKNRCLSGLYLDTPNEWDDPYRHFRW
jgi:beta-galactosidase